MRPIKLRIKGLNSFMDEQIIDFDKLTDRGFLESLDQLEVGNQPY